MMQSFTIKPKDLIQSGKAEYDFNPLTGEINYKAWVKAGFNSWLAKKVETSGIYSVDPNILLSKNFTEVGKEIRVGELLLTVSEVKGMQARAQLALDGQDYAGEVVADLSNLYVKLLTISAKGTVYGKEVHAILMADM